MPWHQTNAMDQRTEFALKALGGVNFRALCRDYGISAKTGYKWKERFLTNGLGGMAEQSRRPHTHADALSELQVCAIVKLRQAHPYWGARKLQELYRRQRLCPAQAVPSESSFKRVLERAGLVSKRRVRTVTPSQRLHNGSRGEAPNEVWTVDFKGWWFDPLKQRCEPLTVRDEHSRYLLESRRLPNSRCETVGSCFEKLFERHGLPQTIRSDNGAPFASPRGILGLSQLSSRWVALGINLERGRPGCPQDNGAHERMHRDLKQQMQRDNRGWTQEALDLWREEYNHERPHEALGMRVPAEVYTHSRQRYGGLPQQLDYGGLKTRMVNKLGCIRWGKTNIFISQALAGWHLGLQPCSDSDELLDLTFCNLLLGQLDPITLSFNRCASAPIKTDNPSPTM